VARPVRNALAPARALRRSAPVCRAAAKAEDAPAAALPLAAMVAAGLLLCGISPDDALAARSGGRVGGGSFSGARARSAPRR
jgi:uncharacterized membrane protein